MQWFRVSWAINDITVRTLTRQFWLQQVNAMVSSPVSNKQYYNQNTEHFLGTPYKWLPGGTNKKRKEKEVDKSVTKRPGPHHGSWLWSFPSFIGFEWRVIQWQFWSSWFFCGMDQRYILLNSFAFPSVCGSSHSYNLLCGCRTTAFIVICTKIQQWITLHSLSRRCE